MWTWNFSKFVFIRFGNVFLFYFLRIQNEISIARRQVVIASSVEAKRQQRAKDILLWADKRRSTFVFSTLHVSSFSY